MYRSPSKRHRVLFGICLAVIMILSAVGPHLGARPAQLANSDCSLLRTSSSSQPYCWAILGYNSSYLRAEYQIGVRYKLFSLSWRQFYSSEGVVDDAYVHVMQSELAQLRQAGLKPILSLGIQDAPSWLHANYPDSYYVSQFGQSYKAGAHGGDANLVFNPILRALADTYIHAVFQTFGTDFSAVRLGGGRYGELTYPPAAFGLRSNLYWSFDANALARSPVPRWRPSDASPQGEARTFLIWYLDSLVDFQNWQINAVRQSYAGPLMMLYPSWGMRPGDFESAVATNLNGSSSAEQNGEVQRGFDFAGQIAAITDRQVVVTTTWLDADRSGDSRTDQRYWSPVHYLSYLAQANPLHLSLFGENTGGGNLSDRASVGSANGALWSHRHGVV